MKTNTSQIFFIFVLQQPASFPNNFRASDDQHITKVLVTVIL